jgi:dTDP-D-glucose 4,6-dehydratase
MTNSILVTGGAGFIGSNFVLDWLAQTDETVVNLDKLSYAGNLQNLASLENDERHTFVKGDIADMALVAALLHEHQPRAIVNFAAESHVDRSIHGPEAFIHNNIVGTFNLLETVRAYWTTLESTAQRMFGSCTYRLTKSMVHCARTNQPLLSTTHTSPIALTAPAKPLAIIWFGHGTTRTGFRF